MILREAERIADAVLYEGYVLYPYRASAPKNRLRWQVGLLMPRAYAEAAGSDPFAMQAEVIAEVGPEAALTVRLRCLHVQARTVERPADGGRTWELVEAAEVDGRDLLAWDEAVAAELVRERLPLGSLPAAWRSRWLLENTIAIEEVADRTGQVAARIVRRREPVEAAAEIAVERCDPQRVRIRVRIENLTPCAARSLAERDAAIRGSLAGTHMLLGIEGGEFVSLLEPSPDAAALASSCVNTGVFPVLVGPRGSRAAMLASPIILYDYPSVAPESTVEFCDGTEIDEMLVLRVKTLTEEEKRAARATDGRSARIVDYCDAASAGVLGRVHGAFRDPQLAADAWERLFNPPDDDPERASIEVGGTCVAVGDRVRLAPSHRADSLDLCIAGRTGTVTGVYRTIEDRPYVAVSLDDDPLAASGLRYRRALFFHPDEIVPIGAGPEGAP